jgi:hypothetical protein
MLITIILSTYLLATKLKLYILVDKKYNGLTHILTITHNRLKMNSGIKGVLTFNNLPLTHVKNYFFKCWC